MSAKSELVNITFPDGTKQSIPKGTKLQELAEQANREALAAQVDGSLIDLSRSVEKDAVVSFVSASSKKGLEILRHSASHVMAQAVKELFPKVKLTFGPSTENGFYYDFDYDRTFSPQDLEQIEKRMAEIIQQDEPFIRKEVSKAEAIKMFQQMGESYKVEHLEDLPDHVSLYRQGSFLDLCEGPHLPSTGRIKAFCF
jgi:threonyl-tRNA synthetase